MADPAVKAMPRAPALKDYDIENERRYRAQVDDELRQKHDMRSDLRVGVGKSLILSAPGGLDYAIGLDDDGFVTVDNYETGASGTLVIRFDSVEGLAQEFIDVRAEFAAADGAVSSAYIAADAVVAANATSARATLSSTLTAAYTAADGAVTSGAISYTDSVVATEAGVRASADSVVQASVYSTAQRPNLMAQHYQLFGAAEGLPFVISGGAKGSPAIDNPWLVRDAEIFTSDGSSSQLLVRFTPGNGQTNITLPAGRKYAFKIDIRTTSGILSIVARLRDASNSSISAVTISRTGNTQTLSGVWDLTSATGSEYYLEIQNLMSGSLTGENFYPYRVQIEQITASETGPGDWSSGGLNASVKEMRDAFIDTDTGKALARYVLEASASGGTPAIFSLYSDSEGSANIALNAPQIYFGDNTTFEDSYNSFYTETGVYRYRFGGPFPASGDLVQWYGPVSVPLNSETKTNGVFAFATDGEVYLGSAALTGEASIVTGNTSSSTWTNSSATYQTIATIDITTPPALGYLENPLANANIVGGPAGINGSSTTGTYQGKWRIREQLQSGGTSYTIDSGTFTLGFDASNLAILTIDRQPLTGALFSQNLSGAVRYTFQIGRNSGTNGATTTNTFYTPQFAVRRVPAT